MSSVRRVTYVSSTSSSYLLRKSPRFPSSRLSARSICCFNRISVSIVLRLHVFHRALFHKSAPNQFSESVLLPSLCRRLRRLHRPPFPAESFHQPLHLRVWLLLWISLVIAVRCCFYIACVLSATIAYVNRVDTPSST
jgi:hypothetical protein